MDKNIQTIGNMGLCIKDGEVISFQMGDTPSMSVLGVDQGFPVPTADTPGRINWRNILGYKVASRGYNNLKCEEVTRDIKKNRLLPRLITKQVAMLYGQGPAVYKASIVNGGIERTWVTYPEVQAWLDSWESNGMEMGYKDFAKSNIKNFYYFRDFFCKFRFSMGKDIIPGTLPISGIESLENSDCRLATLHQDITGLIPYRDLTAVIVGRWAEGYSSSFKIYPRFFVKDIGRYNFAAVSHHREKSVSDYYGENETHEGSKEYIKGSNDTARYINSFLKNSLAAKIHIVIPNAWLESKRQQITKLCDENKRRDQKNEALIVYNNIEIGTEYKESLLVQYTQAEVRKIASYLSGVDNQGKAYASFSYKAGNGEEQRWKIETIDLKYKEYIESLITYDKRADEVLISSVGLDSSITGVSKDGVISKSGSDAYYNFIIYLSQLWPEDEICSEPFNIALKINFPKLYEQGYRIGYYRQIPQRQQDITPSNRIENQQV